MSSPLVYLTRVETFSAAHRLHNHGLSDEENKEIYGKCNNPNGHGHNYKVEVTVKGQINSTTGFLMNLVELKDLIGQVLCLLDHKNIDQDVKHFYERKVVSSAENIAVFIFDSIAEKLPNGVCLHSIKLHETDKNIVEFKGETI